jgi:2-polyprenyl-3-methyl-5-hydroxy-6-metoxy-1,4-benzoquinol methylase
MESSNRKFNEKVKKRERTLSSCKHRISNLMYLIPFIGRILRFPQEYRYRHCILDYVINRSKQCKLDCVTVESINWASRTFIASKDYINLTLKLTLIDLTILKNELEGNITPSLHWGRRFEYPYIYYRCISNSRKKLVILDAGAGLNPLQILLALSGHFIVSLDNDVKVLIRLSKILKDNSKLKIFPCLADVFQLPFKENFFDCVICISVIEHILDYLNPKFDLRLSYAILKTWLCELARVTKPGGRICVTLDIDLSKRRHLTLDEVAMLGKLIKHDIPPMPADIIVSNRIAFGELFAPQKTVIAIIMGKEGESCI